jgi:hypothetical protein
MGELKMANSKPITLVVFRRWKENGDIIALFPELPSDINGFYCDSYEHVGQHGGADYYGVIQATKPVAKRDAQELARELTRIGYRLKPIKRASYRMHEVRRATASAIRTSRK